MDCFTFITGRNDPTTDDGAASIKTQLDVKPKQKLDYAYRQWVDVGRCGI